MANILNTTQVYNAADVVTHTNLNQIISGATFVAGNGGSTDNVTLEVDGTSGSLQVKDGGIDQDKLTTGHPKWNATAGRLYVDGMIDSNNRLTAGISINGNLTGDQGYAFVDLHGDQTTSNQYVRLLNSNGTCYLQNKKAGRSIALETTDSSGTIRTGLKVDASQNVTVENGQLHVKPISFAGNQNGYLLRGGANNNTSWDNFGIQLKSNSTGGPYMVARTHSHADVMSWNTNKVGINTAFPSAALTVNGSINYSGSLTHTSDHRLKENVNDLSGSLDKLTRLNGKSYTLIDDEEGQTEFGFIAQEVEEVFPEVVQEVQKYELDENGEETTKEVNYMGVSYLQLIAPMVEAIKELKSQNETLEARIESLENS